MPRKYPAPDATPCVALVKRVNDHLATVRPLRYRAEAVEGMQGRWRIEAVNADL
ncbi:MAG: hypothetical protein ABS888_05205 [Eubacteriales bacterium]